MGDQIELNDWLGPNANLVRTTEYDDIVNGIDAVVEFDTNSDKPERMALAVDASMSPDFHVIAEKIRKNANRVLGIEDHAKVKYFESQITNRKESLNDMVPVVIGVDADNLAELLGKFSSLIKLQNIRGKSDLERSLIRKTKEELANHPAQKIFLEEIRLQLEWYLKLIKSSERVINPLQPAEIEKLLSLVLEILKIKDKVIIGELESDGVYAAIRNGTLGHPSSRVRTD